MLKTIVSCGTAILLRDSENSLAGIGTINAGTILVSAALAKRLAEAGTQLNCGSAHTIQTPAHPILLSGNATLDANTDYDGCYLVCEDALVIRSDGIERAAALEGAFVDGPLYYPASLPARTLAKLIADQKIPYPDGAQLFPGDVRLDAKTLSQFADNTQVCVGGTLYALDSAAAQAAHARGISFTGGAVVTYAGLYTGCHLQGFAAHTLVPDGYTAAEEAGDLDLLHLTHGAKVCVLGDLLIQPRDGKALAQFDAIAVCGTAKISRAAYETAKQVVHADTLKVFEGELVSVNGQQTMDHAYLDAARQSGVRLTVKVNGMLTFADDVTPEDIAAIAALDYNGVVTVSGPVRQALQSVIGRANGALRDSKQAPDGDKQEKSKTINMGTYVLMN